MYIGFASLVLVQPAQLPVWYSFDEVQLPAWSPPLPENTAGTLSNTVIAIYNPRVLRLPKMTTAVGTNWKALRAF